MSTAKTIASDEAAVLRAVNGFAEAWNSHDMEAFGALFAPDAEFVNVTGLWWKGCEEIQRNHAFVHGSIARDAVSLSMPAHLYGVFKTSTHSFDLVEVRFIRSDVAIAHGAWTLVGDARTPIARHGVMTLVLRHDGDRWVYAAVQNTEINRSVS